ncbi:hypothetical protein [Corallincola spongiicola]|uniref:Uncharacterized protein n=1 Tax=Corallincola spongiicola TaxID=2520508 RepID=A0ABY1WLQ2_9GAMM|nr:hypothetical protein [Corallincola spongiicola]TAA41845.1 hypothetical protein EXY25_16565 [Corallincola spongiicola]
MELDHKYVARLKHWTIFELTDINDAMLQQQMDDPTLHHYLLVGEVESDNSGQWQPGSIVKSGWLRTWDLEAHEVEALTGRFQLAGAALQQNPLIKASTKQLLEQLGLRQTATEPVRH